MGGCAVADETDLTSPPPAFPAPFPTIEGLNQLGRPRLDGKKKKLDPGEEARSPPVKLVFAHKTR